MTSTLAAPLLGSVGSMRRLLVTVRDHQTGRYRPVGFLTNDADGYSFAYLRRERERDDFRPLPGLARAVDSPAHSTALFPLFAERVIPARRPDREASLTALGLSLDAAPFEVLVRSHGQRVGDRIELLPAPAAAAGEALSFTFLTHGVRHLPPENQARITDLGQGELLLLRVDPTNPVDPRARLVTDEGNMELGWLPGPLLDVVERVGDRRLSVERANGPEVGFHFRLLVRLDGHLTDGPPLFEGPEWATEADLARTA